MTSGRPFLRWAFAAIATAESVSPWESLERVLPVQGAISSASRGREGPRASASAMVVMTGPPVSSMSRRMFSTAVPKRVSVSAAVSLMIPCRA